MVNSSGFKFPIQTSGGNASSTIVDMADMFVRRDYFTSGTLYGWDNNDRGQAGTDSLANTKSPTIAMSQLNWLKIRNRSRSSLGIRTDGTLWTWGYNGHGELAQNLAPSDGINRSPIQVGAGYTWKEIGSGRSLFAAIRSDGTLWTCGRNDYGQLGIGVAGGTQGDTSQDKSSMVQVGSATDWKLVDAANAGYSIGAIKNDGTLWMWGGNQYCTLGTGDGGGGIGTMGGAKSSPTQVGSLTTWKDLSVGSQHTLALKTDGTLWAWGRDGYGQIGTGVGGGTYFSTPVQVGTGNYWKQISAGANHSAAVRIDGTVWAWGYNGQGELGLGDTTNRSSPTQIGGLTTWKMVQAGANESMFMLKTDGTIWGTGANYATGLNQPSDVAFSSPVQVSTLTGWKVITCGYAIMALYDPDL